MTWSLFFQVPTLKHKKRDRLRTTSPWSIQSLLLKELKILIYHFLDIVLWKSIYFLREGWWRWELKLFSQPDLKKCSSGDSVYGLTVFGQNRVLCHGLKRRYRNAIIYLLFLFFLFFSGWLSNWHGLTM